MKFANTLKLALAAGILAATFHPAAADIHTAPFGDKVGAVAVNYNRATPNVASAGLIEDGAATKLADLGFVTVVDLRGPEEGAQAERPAIEAAGLTYINIPVVTKAPTAEQIAEFAAVVENEDNWPILVHCITANRVGAMWALYRAHRGIPPEIAIEEGRTIGLTSRELVVRKQLGLASLQN